MPGLNKIRKRPITLVFRVSSNEAKQINERIAISGLPRGKYFIKTFLEQEITMNGGKFESDRLSLEFKRLYEKICSLKRDEEINDVLEECIALMKELKPYFPIVEGQKGEDDIPEFDDPFIDVEIF